jgi:hypothetical protein
MWARSSSAPGLRWNDECALFTTLAEVRHWAGLDTGGGPDWAKLAAIEMVQANELGPAGASFGPLLRQETDRNYL